MVQGLPSGYAGQSKNSVKICVILEGCVWVISVRVEITLGVKVGISIRLRS